LTDSQKDFSDIFQTSDFSEFYNVLQQMLDGSKDIDLKTEIHRPRIISIMQTITEFANQLNLKQTADTLRKFVIYYYRNMVSFNRGSRKEIVQALQSIASKLLNESNENDIKKVL